MTSGDCTGLPRVVVSYHYNDKECLWIIEGNLYCRTENFARDLENDVHKKWTAWTEWGAKRKANQLQRLLLELVRKRRKVVLS